MKVTYQEVLNFNNIAAQYLTLHPEENKLAYAIRKVNAQAVKLLNDFNVKIEDLRIEHCATDERGLILRDANNSYQFSKEGLKKFTVDNRALLAETVEISPFFAVPPEGFDERFREALQRWVLPKPLEA